jgi:hypothetical protein
MGRGTIQQSWVRIKQRYRLFVYDLGRRLQRLFGRWKEWVESGSGQAYMEVVSLISVAVIAFFVGRYSVDVDTPQHLTHDTSRQIVHIEAKPIANIPAQGKVVVSKQGKRWHYAWCPGASTISEKNKRWYKTEVEAEKVGYTKASNCK